MTSTASAYKTGNAPVPYQPAAVLCRVAMIVGDQKTLHCGVKDCAKILARVLPEAGVLVDVLAPVSWSPSNVLQLIRQIRRGKYDVLHIQYPSIGYRYTLIPHLLGLLRLTRGTVVTLHEYSSFKLPQKLSTHLFRLSAGTILFVSGFERSRYNEQLGPAGPRQELSPLLSQVPAMPSSSGRDLSVVYFGQIRPDKGLEAFLALARYSVTQRRLFSFHVIGSVSGPMQGYAQALQNQVSGEEVRWSFDLSFEEVGEALGRSFAAYLPFPDGASERRGSLLAAWINGLPTLSLVGSATTAEIAELILPVNTPEEALDSLDRLAASPTDWQFVSERVSAYAQKHTWEDVARRHADAYHVLLRS